MNYKKMLPVQQKKKDQGISEDEMKTSRVQRRKKLDPKKWASRWLKDSGGIPARVCLGDIDKRLGVICMVCGSERFADVYGFPNPKTFVCDPCKDKVVTKSIESGNMCDTTENIGPGENIREARQEKL